MKVNVITYMSKLRIDIVAKSLLAWVVGVTIFIAFINKNKNNPFFNFGPNDNLTIFYIKINTAGKYIVVIFYTLISTIVRTLQSEVMTPWIIQSIQNEGEKTEYARKYAYEIVIIDGIYRWFDWFMYMNILLTQFDMMLMEVIGNLFISYITTYYYLNHDKIKNFSYFQLPS